MAEIEFESQNLSLEEKYQLVSLQVPALLDSKADWVANTSNVCAALKEIFGWLWIGFYRKASDDYLQLGPFQGPVACTFIHKGKGVCGTAWAKGETIVVADVDKFPGHIACSSRSRSEIVLPLYKNNEFWGVLDIDSENLGQFSEIDSELLNGLARQIEAYL